MARIQFVHVPYRGSAPGPTDVMAGQIQGMFDNVTSSFELRTVQENSRVRSASRQGNARKPCPTCRRSQIRFPDLKQARSYGVGAPRGTPQNGHRSPE